jgi:regulator of sigma E protease
MKGADVPLYQAAAAVVGAVEAGSPADRAGIKPGDRIVSIDGRDIPNWDALDVEVTPRANRPLAVAIDRRGERLTLEITPAAFSKYEIGDLGVRPVLRPQFVEIQPGMPAERAGFQRGDVVLALDGQRGIDQPAVIAKIKKSADTQITFTIERNGEAQDIAVMPDKGGVIGVTLSPYEVRRVDPTVLQAFALSAQQNWDSTKAIGRTLSGLLKRELPVKQLMGPVAIAELSGSAANLGPLALFQFLSMISLNLGLVNLLPVPVLDGGHIAILAVEGVTRRDLSVRVKERILLAGAALIVLLMVTVIYNDVMRLFR